MKRNPQALLPKIDREALIGAFIDGVNTRKGREWRDYCIRVHGPHWQEEWKRRAKS